jgi:hypothetical protein
LKIPRVSHPEKQKAAEAAFVFSIGTLRRLMRGG